MSHDYSYREMKKMQEDAIERVWEMQRRATLPIEQEPKISTVIEEKHTYKPHKTKKCTKDLTNVIPNRITHIIKDDELCEQILLISIIVLLMNEKADNILILAILYILSD